MKFAFVGAERREAQPNCSGTCAGCAAVVIAKCGEVRIHHWAHKGTRACDPWWENETEWHRGWKNEYPEGWQEMRVTEDGTWHVADVKTEHGVVIEFQHSYLKPAERRARAAFYKKMVWVIDGRSRPRDRARLDAALSSATVISRQPLLVSVSSDDGGLLRDWEASRVPVYFDFGGSDLWRMNPHSPNGRAHLLLVTKASFVKAHRDGLPFEEPWTQDIERAVSAYLMQQAASSRPLTDFERTRLKAQAGVYQDLPDGIDFQASLKLVKRVQEAFASLPSKVRNRFENDPARFLAFCSDPANGPELVALGIQVGRQNP